MSGHRAATSSAPELWSTYQTISAPQLTDNYKLEPFFARQTPAGDMAQGLIDNLCRPTCNLLAIRNDGKHRYLHFAPGLWRSTCTL